MVTRSMSIGMWVWPCFTVLDAYMCFVAYPGASFGRFLVYRAVVELAFFGAYWASRHTEIPVSRLSKWQDLCYGFAALAISLMALELGGIRSPYMHGISVVALVRAAVVPTHWRRSLMSYGRIGFSFPLVISAAILVSPRVRTEWLARDALVFFTSHYIFVVSSALLGLITGHIVWRTQQQLYQARRLGRYRLQVPIGKGGMGDVWLAWDQTLGRNVALKILRTASAPSAEALRRFEREAHAAGQLRGPHVVQIFDFGASDDGLYYIAMEYLQGMDLATLVERFGPLPPSRAIHVAMQACLALEEAHGAGIIHRDIKPHNLFMTRVGDDPDFVKLLDFGVARLREQTSMSGDLTWTGVVVGTPSYIAPELLEGAPADERSDLYALGVTLHVLMTGRSPMEILPGGRVPPGVDVHTTDGNVQSHAPSPPPDVVPILQRCLKRNPDDRIQSARALYDALAAVYDPDAWTLDDARAFWGSAEHDRLALAQGSRDG